MEGAFEKFKKIFQIILMTLILKHYFYLRPVTVSFSDAVVHHFYLSVLCYFSYFVSTPVVIKEAKVEITVKADKNNWETMT